MTLDHPEHTAAFCPHRADDERGERLLRFRLIGVQDEQRLQDFFHSHSAETIHLRYGMMMRELTHQRALQLVQLDGHNELALIGLDGPGHEERIVAIGRYFLDETTNLAELAFVVHEQFRDMGIATHLLRQLVKIMRGKKFSGVTAQVLAGNTSMLHVLGKVLGRADQIASGFGETTLIYRFKSGSYTERLSGHCDEMLKLTGS